MKIYLLENYLGMLFLYSLHAVSIFVEIHNSNLSEAKNSIAQKVYHLPLFLSFFVRDLHNNQKNYCRKKELFLSCTIEF